MCPKKNIYDLGLVVVIVDFVVNMHVRCYCDCGNGPAATVVAGQRTVLATVECMRPRNSEATCRQVASHFI